MISLVAVFVLLRNAQKTKKGHGPVLTVVLATFVSIHFACPLPIFAHLPLPISPGYREEKSLRHVATVAKFLDDNKPPENITQKANSLRFI